MTTFEIVVIAMLALWLLSSFLFVFAFITFATNFNEKIDTLSECTMAILDHVAMSVEKNDKLKEE